MFVLSPGRGHDQAERERAAPAGADGRDARAAQGRPGAALHQYSALHTTSKICGGCHNVDHPVNGMHLETTYTEWEKSPQARKGIQCQDCHMSESPPTVGPSAGSRQRRPRSETTSTA